MSKTIYSSTAFGGKETKRDARERKANERNAVRAKRSDREQLKVLDSRFGEGKGAKKERAKLLSRIAKSTPVPAKS
ncbi:MAG: hypothetical protein HY226_05375 [Candidatus Vogelbacteria bacterium]|nr:hypothetical protein [Candidatus Vogelbacteria bacterium]